MMVDGLDVIEAIGESFFFGGEAEAMGEADGVEQPILGVAIAGVDGALVVRFVHVVVGLFCLRAEALERGEVVFAFGFFGHAVFLL
jgi:hypothetical protein